MERLQKRIAASGYASRRKAEELIKNGHVKVNGQLITEMGYLVSNDAEIIIDNKVITKCGFKFTHKENKEHCSIFKPEPVTVNWYELRKE